MKSHVVLDSPQAANEWESAFSCEHTHRCTHTHIDVLTVLNGHFITQSKDLKSYLIITKPIQH